MEPTEADRLQAIIHEFNAPLGAFIRSRVNDPGLAEDLLQEVWMQLSRTFQDQPPRHISGWLYQVARNKVIDAYRKKTPEWLEEYLMDEEGEISLLQEAILEGDEDPGLAFVQDQFWESFYEALEALPPAQREVFVKNELEGMTLREIAEASGENLKTIISRKGYAVRTLREHLLLFVEEFLEE